MPPFCFSALQFIAASSFNSIDLTGCWAQALGCGREECAEIQSMSFAAILDNLAMSRSAVVRGFASLLTPKTDAELDALADRARQLIDDGVRMDAAVRIVSLEYQLAAAHAMIELLRRKTDPPKRGRQE